PPRHSSFSRTSRSVSFARASIRRLSSSRLTCLVRLRMSAMRSVYVVGMVSRQNVTSVLPSRPSVLPALVGPFQGVDPLDQGGAIARAQGIRGGALGGEGSPGFVDPCACVRGLDEQHATEAEDIVARVARTAREALGRHV